MPLTTPSRLLAVVVICFTSLLATGGCTISEKEELAMGKKLHPQFERESGGAYPDTHVQQYVNAVGQTVCRYAGRPTLEWQFVVVNSDQINAFAVPGGYIYLTRGLLFRLSNEAQLAGVLAHESGHIAKRHSAKQLGRQRTTQVGSSVVGIVGGLFGYGWAGNVTSAVAGLSNLSYSRDQEKEADMEGLSYMSQAGYNPQGLIQLMQVLKSSGGKGGPQFLSTHPDPGNRIGYLTDTIRDKYAGPAQSGEFGEANFQQHVLSRRTVATVDDVRK
jgi:predicted Zn-dependent protease